MSGLAAGLISVALLALVLTGVCRAGKLLHWHAEVQRKVIHVLLGLYVASFPLLFDNPLHVAGVCAAAAALLALARFRPALKRTMGDGLHAVQRVSYGEFLFVAAIASVFYFSGGNTVLYVLPMLILTVADASAALVGVAYGRTKYGIDDGFKSWEGTIFFFLVSMIVSMACLLLMTDLPRGHVIALSLTLAILGALLEGISWRGMDNLFIPAGLHLFLAAALAMPIAEVQTVILVFLCVLLAMITLAPRVGHSPHIAYTLACIGLVFWIVGGWYTALPALTLLAILGALNRKDSMDDKYPALLEMSAIVILSAFVWRIGFHLFDATMVAPMALTFGVHTLMVIGRAERIKNIGAWLYGWSVASVIATCALVLKLGMDGALAPVVAVSGILLISALALWREHAVVARMGWIFRMLLAIAIGALVLPVVL